MRALDPRFALLRQFAAFAVLLAVWEEAGYLGMLNPLFMPTPSKIGAALWDLFADGRRKYWVHRVRLIGHSFSNRHSELPCPPLRISSFTGGSLTIPVSVPFSQ